MNPLVLRMTLMLAQAPAAQTIAAWAVYGVVICGIIALVILFIQWAGISIPPPIVKALWIVLAVLFFVFAIRLVAGMM